jgi:hypothetical protein
MSQMDEQVIRRAAEAAVNDLQLNCRIEKVSQHPRSNDKWCVQFTGDYGQFCDEFRNKSGQENSPEVIREKVKSYFLKMRKPVRVRRGSSHKTESVKSGSILSAAPLEIVGQAIDQTHRLVGEVVSQVSGLARSALDTEAVVSIELPVAASTPPPAPKKSKQSQQPAKKRTAGKSASKATRKAAPRASKATSKAGKAGKVVKRKSRATAGRTTSAKKGR